METPKKILIVDDDQDFSSVLEERLKHQGYQISVAHNSEEAVAAVRFSYPDLILMDLGLPDAAGDITALRIKSENGNRYIPVIALTGHNDSLTRATTRELGFADHIVKPYEVEDLFKRIETLIKNAYPERRHDE